MESNSPLPSLHAATPRSLLFVPADSDRKMVKARQAGADAVIFDLEDSVAPAAKAQARLNMRAQLDAPRASLRIVRVNAADTDWYLEDLVAACSGEADAIMLPKCRCAADLARLDHQLAALETACGLVVGRIAILPLVTETASALGDMAYGGVTPRLLGLGFAGEDLAADLGVKARDALGLNPLLADARARVAIAAAAAGVGAIDTPFPDPADAAGLADEAASAVRLGYAGKLCIHPAQIDEVHAAFSPGDIDITWAKAVGAAFAGETGAGVALLDGKMIDRAHLRLATRILARAGEQ
jgi:citrate lyase subunit beta / citryl-CoA lyase